MSSQLSVGEGKMTLEFINILFVVFTERGLKREAHINLSMVTCKMTAPVTGTALKTTGPVPADSRQ